MTYGSLFTGIGGFDLACDRAGMECAYQCEIDKNCNKLLAERFPNVPRRYTDVHDVGRDAPPVDVLCAGWPCQDLSIAGRRAGLDGERSGLWFEVLRILRETRPAWFLGENVPGLLNSRGGRDFATVLSGLVNLGYCVSWRVLDAQYFGLAQRRKRVFIVASLGNGRAAQVLFEREGVRWYPPSRQKTGQDVAGTLGGGSGERGWSDDTDRTTFVSSSVHSSYGNGSPRGDGADNQIVGTLSANRGGRDRPAGNANELDFCVPVAATLRSGSDSPQAHGKENGSDVGTFIARTLSSRNEGIDAETETFVTAFDWQSGGDVRHNVSEHSTSALQASQTPAIFHENMSGNLAEADAARRLRAEASHSYQFLSSVRRLMPVECERLQGFPDSWTEGFADGIRYKMLGNSVAVSVVTWIATRLSRVITT